MTAGERKEAIYAAAEALFGERGYPAVTMADIAAATGMSKKTLYAVFPDKASLLKGLVASSYIWPEDAFTVAGDDTVANVRLQLRVIANHVLSARHINLCRLAIAESVGFDGLATTFMEMGIDRGRDSMVRLLKRMDRRHLVVDLPPATLAGMLYGGTAGFHLMTALLTGRQPDLKAVYRAIDIVVARLFRS
jgi:AcrR family transcriptional regulator